MAAANVGFLDSYLPYLLRKADQTLSAAFYSALTRHGVTRSEWRVLAVLAEIDRLSMIELAREALSPQPTVTHAVHRLEQRGLVTRSVGAQDKRQRFVSATPAGEKLTTVLIAQAEQLSSKALANVGDLSAMVKELQRLTRVVETNLSDDQTEIERAG